MTTATKAIAGIGGLLATATVPSAYLTISSSSSGSGEETDKVDNRKTGTKWLLGSGYTFNKPTFQSQNHLSHGCAENLFSNNKEELDPTTDTKFYGCAVMKMDLWKTGKQFNNSQNTKTNIDPKWIQFNSEIAIRKENEGWVINARFDNLHINPQDSLAYMLTSYKYNDNQWQKNEETKLWMDPKAINVDSSVILNEDISTSNEQLVIKSPGGDWFNDSDWVFSETTTTSKHKIHEKTENWSGVWIDSTDKEEGSWIFKDIELYIGDKKYSQIFCEEGESNCFQPGSRNGGSIIKKTAESDTWLKATNESSRTTQKVTDVIPTTVKTIIDKLKSSKGSWKQLEDICELDGDLSDEQQKQLRMYCSKGRESK